MREKSCFPPFPEENRASGLLLPVTSLPSDYGIGDLGPRSYSWIDRLHEAGQQWWQALPLGPTGYGNSSYQPLSSFAGNDLLLSPDALDCKSDFGSSAVDYDSVVPFKERLLERAWANFGPRRKDLRVAFEEFCAQHASWLDDYALFRALRNRYHGASYLDWPTQLVQREGPALDKARQELGKQLDQVRFAQFLFFRQAEKLKEYARSKGVRLIGDLVFFASPDSSDVWANPDFFLLGESRRPRFVAGVPPDHFSADGQMWGNPVYNWDALRSSGYRWCIDRLRSLLLHVDLIRLDHFRGFIATWHIPAGAPTARSGKWIAGPGANFFHAAEASLGSLPFLAEDPGLITPEVETLRDTLHVPGTRVLQFAFDGNRDNPHLPHNFVRNTVVYTGTHDNATSREWYEELPDVQRQNLWRYLNRAAGESAEVAPALTELAWSSVAALAIEPLQDLLNLGSEGWMNVPGRANGNWRWRCTENMMSAAKFQSLGELTRKAKQISGKCLLLKTDEPPAVDNSAAQPFRSKPLNSATAPTTGQFR